MKSLNVTSLVLIHISVTILSSADDIDTNNNAAFESVD